MITFENWEEVRHTMTGFDQTRIVNELIHACVQARLNDSTVCDFTDKSQQRYDNGWQLEFTHDDSTIYKFSFNCLKLYLFYNHQELENSRFYRSVDLFFKLISDKTNDIDKRNWLERMYKLALTRENQKKADDFIENMEQYFTQLQLMDDMKCLIK
jgi:hypothetical protein|tara:strand:+ start:728 stop:1195 length:468 start_codon:yes stop_codon:yes gene_type:complete